MNPSAKVPHIEAAVMLAIEPQHAFHLDEWDAPLRGAQMPFVDQPIVPADFIPTA